MQTATAFFSKGQVASAAPSLTTDFYSQLQRMSIIGILEWPIPVAEQVYSLIVKAQSQDSIFEIAKRKYENLKKVRPNRLNSQLVELATMCESKQQRFVILSQFLSMWIKAYIGIKRQQKSIESSTRAQFIDVDAKLRELLYDQQVGFDFYAQLTAIEREAKSDIEYLYDQAKTTHDELLSCADQILVLFDETKTSYHTPEHLVELLKSLSRLKESVNFFGVCRQISYELSRSTWNPFLRFEYRSKYTSFEKEEQSLLAILSSIISELEHYHQSTFVTSEYVGDLIQKAHDLKALLTTDIWEKAIVFVEEYKRHVLHIPS
jgi:hypothetical protein